MRKFGATPEEVKHFATHSTRWVRSSLLNKSESLKLQAEDENGDKYLRLHYDLAIGTPFKVLLSLLVVFCIVSHLL